MNPTRAIKMAQLPPPPAGLSAESREWWTAINASYLLSERELKLLRMAAEAWDDYTKARNVLVDEGQTFLDSRGNPRPRPEIKIVNDSRLAFLKSTRELNLDLAPATPQPPRRDGGR